MLTKRAAVKELGPGKYTAKIEDWRVLDKGCQKVILSLRILSSDSRRHPVGTLATWTRFWTDEMFGPNLKQAIVELNGRTENDAPEELFQQCILQFSDVGTSSLVGVVANIKAKAARNMYGRRLVAVRFEVVQQAAIAA